MQRRMLMAVAAAAATLLSQVAAHRHPGRDPGGELGGGPAAAAAAADLVETMLGSAYFSNDTAKAPWAIGYWQVCAPLQHASTVPHATRRVMLMKWCTVFDCVVVWLCHRYPSPWLLAGKANASWCTPHPRTTPFPRGKSHTWGHTWGVYCGLT